MRGREESEERGERRGRGESERMREGEAATLRARAGVRQAGGALSLIHI